MTNGAHDMHVSLMSIDRKPNRDYWLHVDQRIKREKKKSWKTNNEKTKKE